MNLLEQLEAESKQISDTMHRLSKRQQAIRPLMTRLRTGEPESTVQPSAERAAA